MWNIFSYGMEIKWWRSTTTTTKKHSFLHKGVFFVSQFIYATQFLIVAKSVYWFNWMRSPSRISVVNGFFIARHRFWKEMDTLVGCSQMWFAKLCAMKWTGCCLIEWSDMCQTIGLSDFLTNDENVSCFYWRSFFPDLHVFIWLVIFMWDSCSIRFLSWEIEHNVNMF